MDEIIIEEKKYISSKRAAKITGYAKDYVGQLCREGRVPARLVGRGWYVLESAIQDHRFGNEEETKASTEETRPVILDTWEKVRYEAVSEEVFPPIINRLREEHPAPASPIQDSWRAWFERFDKEGEQKKESIEAKETLVIEKAEEEDLVEEKNDEIEETELEKEGEPEEVSVNVPIHTRYRQAPVELLPRVITHKNEEIGTRVDTSASACPTRVAGKWTRIFTNIAQTTGVLLAVCMTLLAVLGSGYLDKYLVSDSRVGLVAGILVYNR